MVHIKNIGMVKRWSRRIFRAAKLLCVILPKTGMSLNSHPNPENVQYQK
jgi:hypothetical protein